MNCSAGRGFDVDATEIASGRSWIIKLVNVNFLGTKAESLLS